MLTRSALAELGLNTGKKARLHRIPHHGPRDFFEGNVVRTGLTRTTAGRAE